MKRNQKWLSGLFVLFLLLSSFLTPMTAFADSSTDSNEEVKVEADDEKDNSANEEDGSNDEDSNSNEETDKQTDDNDSDLDDNKTSDENDEKQTNDDKATNEENNDSEEPESDESKAEDNETEDEEEASETKERAPPVTVDVRVEGNGETLVPTTEVDVESFDLMEYINDENGGESAFPDSPRAIHAIIQALDEETDLDLNDDEVFSLGHGGNYIHEIDGDGEFTSGGNSGWMYFIDNEYVPVGVLEKELEGAESIVLYYVVYYADNTFSWFDSEEYTVETGDTLKLELTGVNYDVVNPVEGASILVDEEAYNKDDEEVLTDEDGNVDITFDEPGTYHLSANRVNDSGERNIIRPYATVEVSEKPDTDPPAITVEGINDGDEVTEEKVSFTAKAEDDVDGEITPTVKGNEKEIEGTDDEYHVELNEDKNNIAVSATDEAGNTAKETYKVIYTPDEEPDKEDDYNISERIDETASYIVSKGVNSEWEAVGLARAGKDIPSSYRDLFYKHVKSQVDDALSFGRAKITDIERLTIAAAAIAEDPTDINETDLIDNIYNSPMRGATDSMTLQGNNGPIFALIALDSKDFPEPEDAKWTRDKLIEELINNQNDDGSWALNPSFASPSIDITAMAIIGMAPYKDRPEVDESIQGALEYLSSVQNDKGGFTESFVGGTSSEATAQTIIGLTAYGMDPTDEMFTKDGNNLVDHLLTYHNEDGGFAHLIGTGSNAMATEQSIQALVAYDLFLNDEGRLYDFNNVDSDPVVDKVTLENKIKEAENIDVSNKTEESVDNLEKVIEDAKSVLDDGEAADNDIKEAIQDITDAVEDLENKPNPVTDKSELREKVTEAENVDLSNKTPESAGDFDTALNKGKWALATGTIAQEDVDKALYGLEEAMDNLKEMADKEALDKKLEEVQEIDLSDKTEESASKLEEAIDNAKTILGDDNATQSEVDGTLEALQDATANSRDVVEVVPKKKTPVKAGQLVRVENKEKSASIELPENLPDNTKIIMDLIDDDGVNEVTTGDMELAGTIVDVQLDFDKSDIDKLEYDLTLQVNEELTDDTVAIYYFNEEKNEWEYVGGEMNDEGTITATVNHFSKYGVFVIKDGATEEPEEIDKDELEKLIKEAQNTDLGDKTENSTSSLQEVLSKAKTVLEDVEATQSEVDEALIALQVAVDNLDEEKETKKVSNETTVTTNDKDDLDEEQVSHDTSDESDGKNADKDENYLPETATPYYTFILYGAIILVIAAALLIIQRKRVAR